MKRGVVNKGYEKDRLPSTHSSYGVYRSSQVDDRSDWNDTHIRNSPKESYRNNGTNPHGTSGSGNHGAIPRNQMNADKDDEIEMRLRKYDRTDTSSPRKDDYSRNQNPHRETRNRGEEDDIEQRLQKYKCSSDDDISHNLPGTSQRLETPPGSERNRLDDASDIEERLRKYQTTSSLDSRQRPPGSERPSRIPEQHSRYSNRNLDDNQNFDYDRRHPHFRNGMDTSDGEDLYDGYERQQYSSFHRHSAREPGGGEGGDPFEHHDPHPFDDHRSFRDSRRQSRISGWEAVVGLLPSQMDRASGTLRFRGTMRGLRTSLGMAENPMGDMEAAEEENKPKSKAEVYENLIKLREQPWPMRLRRQRKNELKQQLESMGDRWYSVGPVVSAVELGTSKAQDLMDTLDPLHRMLKRIEGNHGASVVAVFNFIRDMIRLNFALALLLLCGVVIPSSAFIGKNDQAFGWYIEGGGCSNTEGDLCSIIQLTSNSSLQECNQNYTNKVEEDVISHSSNWISVLIDFLQGTGFLELSILFSGYYPTLVESSNFLVGLAYLLTVLVTYIISLVFVVHFVAKFLRKTSSLVGDYGMTFSRILFTGWDFTVKESAAAKIESSLFVCEIKAAFDDEEHTRRSLQRTRNENIKLNLGRIFINLIIIALIGGSWAGIYFLVSESQRHTKDTAILKFIWEYAPTLTVAGLNLIFPMVFTFLISYEQYKGRTELFLTLGRCVLVRLTSLGILIITKIGLISIKERVCDADDEFICWETHLGQQVYSVLILDAIIQVGMTLVVNVLRRSLRSFNNAFCQKIGTMEFFVPGHVLDVVYIQAVCWIGLLYSPLIVTVCLIYFCLIFFLKLFTVSVTCIPASRVFRASRSSAMFMTILALAFLVSLVPNALALLYLCPSLACSPFRGLGYAWEVLTYYICNLSGSAYWIRSFLFALDGTIVCVTLMVLVFLCAVYYISIFSARGALIKDLETKLKNANKDKNFLMGEFQQIQEPPVLE